MSPDVILALVSALVGGGISVFSSMFVLKWQGKRDTTERIADSRLAFVREVARNRMDYPQLVKILNEVPIVFGHDVEAVRLYRGVVDTSNDDERTRLVGDLVHHLAKTTGLSPGVQASDLLSGLVMKSTP